MTRYEYVIDWWDLNTHTFANIQRLINRCCETGTYKVVGTTVDRNNNFIVTFQREIE